MISEYIEAHQLAAAHRIESKRTVLELSLGPAPICILVACTAAMLQAET